jgi:thiamine-monophosphate kinase
MKSDEFQLINAIEHRVPPPSARVLLGIGDDTAIVAPSKHPLLLCTDAMVEGIHFDLGFATPVDIGHKALASCLSDIAAMNGKPLYALFSLALPGIDASSFIDGFYEGAGALAKRFAVDIVGGDLSASKGGRFIDVTCVGESANPRTRAGVKPGDWIAVSGHPGASAAGLHVLQNPALRSAHTEALVRAHLRPLPRFDLLESFERSPKLCTAMIDISDGLSSELHHLADRSGVRIEIEANKIPFHPEAVALAKKLGGRAQSTESTKDRTLPNALTGYESHWPLTWALSGGEDYELLISLDERELDHVGAPPPGFTLIGRAHALTAGSSRSQVSLRHADGQVALLERSGFNHFRETPTGRL